MTLIGGCGILFCLCGCCYVGWCLLTNRDDCPPFDYRAEALAAAVADLLWVIRNDIGNSPRDVERRCKEAERALENYRGGTVDGAGELLEKWS